MAARRKTKVTDSNELQVGQSQFHEIPAAGNVSSEDFRDQFEVVDGPRLHDKASTMAFMEEKVVVMVHTTNDKTKEPIPCVSVNGINQYIVRGKPQIIKRKFVEGLARAREESVNTPFGRDANGFDTYNISKTQSLKYPFQVVDDPNPNGRAWLEKVMAEA